MSFADEIHKHKPRDIKPQGSGSNLDADKLDGLHASEIGGGGGPHAATHETGGSDKVHFADLEHDDADTTLHDAFVTTPHVSQTEKDWWNAAVLLAHLKQHALDSGDDHTGTITDTQHGSRGAGLHADSHAQLHASSHHTGGGDLLSLGSIPGTLVSAQHPSGLGANLHHAQLHKDTHKAGGTDAFLLADLLDCLARLEIKLGGTSKGKRRGLNFIQGTNVTLTVTDDATNEDVDVTIAASGGGGGGTPESIIMGCMFITLSGFDLYSTGGGLVTKHSWGAHGVTPSTSPYKTYAFYDYDQLIGPAFYNKNPQFECYFEYGLDIVGDLFVLIGGTAGVYSSASEKKFGIRIVSKGDGLGADLKIISSDGTTQSESASLMVLQTTTWYRIRCKLTSATSIEVWVDGVSKGTKSTNLPSGAIIANTACPQIIALGDASNIQGFDYAGMKVMHDY